jgi:hypothetical protein
MGHFTLGVPSGWERSLFHSVQRFVLVSFLFVPFAWLATFAFAFCDGVARDKFRNPFVFLVATTSLTCLYTMAATGSSNNHYIPLFALLEATTVLGTWRIAREGPPRWLVPALVMVTLFGCLVAAAAAWKNEGHPLPLFVAPVLIVAAALGWWIRGRAQAETWALLLLAGQFAASFYLPWDYFPPSDWRTALADFRGELIRLKFDVAWPDYGAVPTALTGMPIHRYPSWVVLEDVARTQHADAADLAPFREQLTARPPAWIVSGEPLESIPVWQEFAKGYTLETDYGSRFASLPQLARHWYGAKIFPRFLYRRSPDR